jgi:hypothetical protein
MQNWSRAWRRFERGVEQEPVVSAATLIEGSMATDILTTLTHLINSPPGQLAAGGVLAGIVWKFFERIEAVLTDQTKLEIAVWLVGVKVGQKVEPWPRTFAKVFDRVFGTKHLSWKCFWRSCLASYAVSLICCIAYSVLFGPHHNDKWRGVLVFLPPR